MASNHDRVRITMDDQRLLCLLLPEDVAIILLLLLLLLLTFVFLLRGAHFGQGDPR